VGAQDDVDYVTLLACALPFLQPPAPSLAASPRGGPRGVSIHAHAPPMNGVHVGVHFEFRIQTRGIGVFSLVGCGFLRRPQLQFFLVEFWI